MCDPSPFVKAAQGVRVRVRLSPKASGNRVTGLQIDAEGDFFLKAQVTAVPEGGKANAALIKLLAKEWKLAKSGVEVIQGATDRNKTLHITGNSEQLLAQLQVWAAGKLKK